MQHDKLDVIELFSLRPRAECSFSDVTRGTDAFSQVSDISSQVFRSRPSSETK